MQRLCCPSCDEVMQVVQRSTEKTRRTGIDQLARHVTEMHVIPSFENALGYTAIVAETSGFDVLFEVTRPLCAGCKAEIHQDNGLYYRGQGRTQQCCDQACYQLAVSRYG